MLHQSFYPFECTTIATEIHKDDANEARQDLDELCHDVSYDGVSVVALDRPSGRVVGFALNKIQIRGQDYYGDFIRQRCRSENARVLIQFMIDVDSKFDLFGHFESECFFELMFLAVLPAFEQRGIGRTLCACSLQLANAARSGELDGLPIELRTQYPQVATSNLSSRHSQRIGALLGFETLYTFPYTDVEFRGRTFADRIGNALHPSTTLVAKRLTEEVVDTKL